MINSITENDPGEIIVKKLAESWNESGLEKGDVVLVHSALSGFLKRFKKKNISLTPDMIIDSFISATGKEGTLLFPTYNFDFTKGILFDIKNTKSEIGVLTEVARLRTDSYRTGHPLFSFAVIGAQIAKFKDLENYTAFGNDSPFAMLLKSDGKIAALDVAGENCMTFYHHVEETEDAPNRYHKKFIGNYKDINGNESVREYDLYARRLDLRVETDVKPMEEYLWEKGFYKGDRPGEGNCLHTIEAKVVYEEAAKLIRKGKSLNMLYKIGKEF